MKKKNKAQKLTKEQLKKLKGGLRTCNDTKCLGDTCGPWVNDSGAHCHGSSENTIYLTEPNSSVDPQKKK